MDVPGIRRPDNCGGDCVMNLRVLLTVNSPVAVDGVSSGVRLSRIGDGRNNRGTGSIWSVRIVKWGVFVVYLGGG